MLARLAAVPHRVGNCGSPSLLLSLPAQCRLTPTNLQRWKLDEAEAAVATALEEAGKGSEVHSLSGARCVLWKSWGTCAGRPLPRATAR